MIKLPKPKIEVEDVLEVCLANVKKEPTLTNIKASIPNVILKSKEYDELAEQGQLGTLEKHKDVPGGAAKEDMVWLYDHKFVADGGKPYYDKIKAIPKYGKCPFCGVGRVSTLDHYLPKTKYPTYAVTPVNLVASCADCNKKKTSDIPEKPEEAFIHPYYDDFDDEIWLKAEISFDEEIIVSFEVEKPDTWDDKKCARAQHHVEELHLDELYIAHCGEEFSGYERIAKKLYEKGGETLVKEDLSSRIEEHRSVMKNNWRAALYEGLLENWESFERYLKA